MEKPAATPVTSTINMGKAMGSGSGIGRAGASALRAPPTPMMGSGMGVGMGMGMNMGMGMGMEGQMGKPGISSCFIVLLFFLSFPLLSFNSHYWYFILCDKLIGHMVTSNTVLLPSSK